MPNDQRAPSKRIDADGVRITRTPGRSVVVPAVLVLAGIGWVVVRTLRSEPPRPVPTERREVPTVAGAAEAPSPPIVAARDAEVAERVRQRHEERRDARREKAEVPYTLNAPGEHAGIAAFPPPGTKPIKRGLVVPDDFELPEGYVRHYQTTDDGRRLPPILMFHPDFAGVDENGNPLAVPEDRIVPPELAPPGLPRRTLDETGDVHETIGRRVHSDVPPPGGR